jgi:hypothetical protein
LGCDLGFRVKPPRDTPAVYIDGIQDSSIGGDKRDIANAQWHAESIIKFYRPLYSPALLMNPHNISTLIDAYNMPPVFDEPRHASITSGELENNVTRAGTLPISDRLSTYS